MSTKPEKQSFRLSSTTMIVLIFVFFIIGLINLMEVNDGTSFGVLMLSFSAVFLGLLIWSYYSPFIPMAIATVLFALGYAYLMYLYPGFLLHGGRLHTFPIAGFLFLFYSAIEEGRLYIRARNNKKLLEKGD